MRATPTLLLLAALAACSRQSPEAPSAPETAAPAAAPGASPPATPPAARGEARSVKHSDALYDFEYSYPAAAGGVPALRAYLDADIAQQQKELATDAKAQQASAKEDGSDYRPLGRWVEWKVVTDLPDWLSLSGSLSSYEGGAHPNSTPDTILWDRRADQRRAPLDLFTSRVALSKAIRTDFCAALDREREEKRSEPVRAASGNEFDQCIDPVESTVILGSSNRRSFDRIGVLVAPYVAGPYVEGEYEVSLPVTPALLAVVKPEYRQSFSVKR